MSLSITRSEWQSALKTVWRMYYQQKLSWMGHQSVFVYYSTKSIDEDHGCPPPLPEFRPSVATELKTATLWQGAPVLWCFPAHYSERELDVDIVDGTNIPIACMGTMFWLMFHAFKVLNVEDEISLGVLNEFKTACITDTTRGFADKAVELGWAVEAHNDPTRCLFGDLAGMGYFDEQGNGEIHHWCIVWDEPQMTYEGKDAILTMGATPNAENAGPEGGLGPEPYDFTGSYNGKPRKWLFARMWE